MTTVFKPKKFQVFLDHTFLTSYNPESENLTHLTQSYYMKDLKVQEKLANKLPDGFVQLPNDKRYAINEAGDLYSIENKRLLKPIAVKVDGTKKYGLRSITEGKNIYYNSTDLVAEAFAKADAPATPEEPAAFKVEVDKVQAPPAVEAHSMTVEHPTNGLAAYSDEELHAELCRRIRKILKIHILELINGFSLEHFEAVLNEIKVDMQDE